MGGVEDKGYALKVLRYWGPFLLYELGVVAVLAAILPSLADAMLPLMVQAERLAERWVMFLVSRSDGDEQV